MELHLKRADELLGTLRSYSTDFPWVNCRFEPLPAFEDVRPLFDEELRLLDTGLVDSDQVEQWEIAYNRITSIGLRLFDIEQENYIDEFLLHIRGDEAWFRY
jgi:hypothetical protein